MFSIGEFSKITGLTVKTHRFYHEQGVLVPSYVDEQTGYRYYVQGKIETARVITQLRRLDFTIDDIREILGRHDDEPDILDYLLHQRETVEEKLRNYQDIKRSLDRIIAKEREARATMSERTLSV